jgi:hypothetical protein
MIRRTTRGVILLPSGPANSHASATAPISSSYTVAKNRAGSALAGTRFTRTAR